MYRANPNRSPLKILEKRKRGRIQRLRKCFVYPLLSQERVKLRTSNFVGTFIASIRTKAHEKCWNNSRGRSQGVPKIFMAPMYRSHCAVIFAIAQLSCCLTHLCLTLNLNLKVMPLEYVDEIWRHRKIRGGPKN